MGARANELMGVVPDPAGPPQPSTLLAAPLFHVSGALPLVSAPVLGTRLVFPPVGPWDEITHLRLTEQHGVGRVDGRAGPVLAAARAPPVRRVRHVERHPGRRWRRGVHARAVPPDGREAAQARVGAGYGMSETFGSAARLGGLTLETHPASVGAVEPLCELRDPRPGRPRASRTARSARSASGAPRCSSATGATPTATADSLDEQRWYRSGDYGRFADGVLQLESRMRDLIIRGGENIYPIEIENRLAEHPAVAEACVVGVPHHQLGQEVAAVVVLHPDADARRRGGAGLGGRVPGRLQGAGSRRVPRRAALQRHRQGREARRRGRRPDTLA